MYEVSDHKSVFEKIHLLVCFVIEKFVSADLQLIQVDSEFNSDAIWLFIIPDIVRAMHIAFIKA